MCPENLSRFRVKVMKYGMVYVVFTIVDDGIVLFTCRFGDIRIITTIMKRT